MKDKLVKSGLAAVSTFGFLLLGSCSMFESKPPNDAIFNSRGGHLPPPRSAGSSVTPPVLPPTNNTVPGLLLNDGPGSGIIIEDNAKPPVQDFSFKSTAVEKMTYKVQKNDSLWSVARSHGVSMQDLARENNLDSKAMLKIGQTLTLPPGARLLAPSERAPIKKSSVNPGGGSQKYKVKKGDSLSVIAYKYNTSTSALKSANNLKSDVIRVNQELIIPNSNKPRSTQDMSSGGNKNSGVQATGNVYTVKKGDSLSVIAHKQGTTVNSIKQANGLKSNNIIVGQKLVIPGGKAVKQTKTSNKQKEIEKELFNVDAPKKEEPMKKEEDNPFAEKPKDEPKKEEKTSTEPMKKEPAPANLNVMDVLVVESDTLESLATDFNTTVELIKKANPNVKGNEDLKPGAVIKVPRGN